MGMQEEAPNAPEVYGLPEYRVKRWAIEIDGTDVRMAFGTTKFGHTEWLYTVVMPPLDLLRCLRELTIATEEAFLIQKMMDQYQAH